MRRRTFVRLTAAASIALHLTGLECKPKANTFSRILSQPGALEHICDAQTIRQIGEAYQNMVPNENNQSVLTRLLATDASDNQLSESSDSASIASYLDKRVRDDFTQNKTVIINGWILSLTEARQCALFSLTAK
jgi:hypothetical protein